MADSRLVVVLLVRALQYGVPTLCVVKLWQNQELSRRGKFSYETHICVHLSNDLFHPIKYEYKKCSAIECFGGLDMCTFSILFLLKNRWYSFRYELS